MVQKNLNNISSNRNLIAIFLLIFTTVLWGTSFILTKIITEDIPIFLYLGIRFAIALVGFIPFVFHLKNVNKKTLLMSIITGMLYFLGVAIQTHGLQMTTAGKAGFITGLSAIIVPFIAWIGFKKLITKRIWIAVALSVIGIAFLFLEGESGIIFGDLIVLLSAFIWAFYIIYNDRYVKLVDIFSYSIIQISLVSCLSLLTSFIIQEPYELLSYPLTHWYILIYLGIGVMSLTILFQNWSQQYQGPATTAIIFTLEPVFAALFGFLIGSEILSFFAWIGCGLIFCAILITVIKAKSNKETSN
ncbi:MAG: DMT family transporter [Candidatus Heimdallarchaeota archaeon]